MKEIGSEFWDTPIAEQKNTLFSESTQWFLSGRSALRAIIKELDGCHTVAMPSWCCDSMIKPFVDAGIEVHLYPVYWQEGLVQEISLDCDAIFLMDYFGHTGKQPDLRSYKGIVIRDVTHSIFSAVYSDAAYYFGSLRKWCGVWTGGYAWTSDAHMLPLSSNDDYCYVSLREKAMRQKEEYIKGKRTDKEYLKVFEQAENALEHANMGMTLDRDVWLAHRLDVEGMKSSRRRNAEVLRKAFSDWLIFQELKDSDCPMFVPILVPDDRRNELRKNLIKYEIYCPVHWPVSGYHKIDERAKHIYMNELSLVCDQRYTEDDMNRMVETIKIFMEDM